MSTHRNTAQCYRRKESNGPVSTATWKEQDVKETTCSTSHVCRFLKKESESTGQLPLPHSTPTPFPFLRRRWHLKKPEFEFRLLLVNSLLSHSQSLWHINISDVNVTVNKHILLLVPEESSVQCYEGKHQEYWPMSAPNGLWRTENSSHLCTKCCEHFLSHEMSQWVPIFWLNYYGLQMWNT